LQIFFAEHPDAKEAHEGGRMEGLASLRRKQFTMAESNASMAIWLGKQYLGQKDQVAHMGPDGGSIPLSLEVTFVRVAAQGGEG
jgi:hypothetical protein